MELDSRTIAFLAVAAFMSLLLLCCIILSVLFYIRYRNSSPMKDETENHEHQRIKRLKTKLMKQFKNDLKKQTSKGRGKLVPSLHIHDSDSIDTSCSICLDSLAEGDPADTILALIIKCGHVFHMDCVWPWLERDHTCPICRRDTELAISDLQAVTVYHILNNLDVPSIRESVSRAGLESRLGYGDGLEVVSINEEDLKTPRTPRVVMPATTDSNLDASSTIESRNNTNNSITIHTHQNNAHSNIPSTNDSQRAIYSVNGHQRDHQNSAGDVTNDNISTSIHSQTHQNDTVSQNSRNQQNDTVSQRGSTYSGRNDRMSQRGSTYSGISRSTNHAAPVIFTIAGVESTEGISNV